MTPRAKRHHQIPVFYLSRFCSGGKVCARWRDGKIIETNPLNVAAESGFYDIPNGEGGKSDVVEQRLLGDLAEGPAKEAIEAIDRSGKPPPEGSNDRATLAGFLALQIARTAGHREGDVFPRRVIDWAQGREVTRDLVAEYLELEHLGSEPLDPEIEGAYFVVSLAMQEPEVLTDDWPVAMMLQTAIDVVPVLLDLRWTIEVDRNREFITSDMPVVLWRKPSDRDNYEGLGPAKAEEIRFPLDPGKQLVLSRRRRPPMIEVAVHRVRRLNRDQADCCHRFLLGSPTNRTQIEAHRLAARRPLIRFWTGPYSEPGPDGRMQRQEGDVVHIWTPRGAGVGPPPASDH